MLFRFPVFSTQFFGGRNFVKELRTLQTRTTKVGNIWQVREKYKEENNKKKMGVAFLINL